MMPSPRARACVARWSTLATATLLAAATLASLDGCASANARANATAFSRDTALTARVKAALLRAASTPDVKVESRDGVVTLSGQVASAEQSVAAADQVRTVEGVDAVINALRVATP